MRQNSNSFYCFSPPAMLATFIIELALAAYTFWRYRSSQVRNLAIIILIFLAIFQLAEYNTCGRFGIPAASWSRLGFVAITFLPVLAINLILTITKKNHSQFQWLAYATAAPWLVFFVKETAFRGHVC